MDSEEFNRRRLRFARKRRGITIKSLGSAVGMTPKIISDYENGKRTPPEKTLSLIAIELNFPVSFFFLDDILTLDETAVSFRSFSKMTASVRDSALGAGQIALEFAFWLDERFELPSVNIPDLRDYEPEAAASTLRDIWSLGELSIGNMIHLLESNGVRVFSLEEKTLDMDAYSFWMNETPFVFVNNKKTVERGRFDAAHELGHLILHKHGSPLGREVELEANRFASAFLMPRGSVISKAQRFPSLDIFIELKSNWRVATSALIRRMNDLNLVSDWHYRSLMIELSKKWGRKKEPSPIKQRETSKLLPMIFRALREEGTSKEDVARDLSVFTSDIDSILFNITLIGVDGGKNRLSPGKNNTKSHLKRIK